MDELGCDGWVQIAWYGSDGIRQWVVRNGWRVVRGEWERLEREGCGQAAGE